MPEEDHMTLRESPPSRLSTPERLPATKGVVVLTGGSAGLGRSAVRAFAGAGYDVAVLARGEDGLAGAVADVGRTGRRGVGIVCDVADHEAVEAAADQVEAELGPIEVWVNDAMTGVFARNRLAPALLDRHLATTGYSGQQSPQDKHPQIGENLYHPVGGDHGAHGDFDHRSHSRSPELWATTHRGSLLAGATAAAITLAVILRGRR
jgi:hypothetical protein